MEIDELRRLAAKEEMSLNYIAKDEMVSKALLELQGCDDTILKGGTAINRVYIGNKRFSEDIDFDLVSNNDAKGAVPRAKEIIAKLEGFTADKPRVMHNTIRYDIFYVNPLEHKDRIRVEFKPVKKAPNYSKKVVNFGFVPYSSSLLNVYGIEEIIMHKVGCIMSRMEGKDFFDLYYLIGLPHKRLKPLNNLKERIIKKITLEENEIKAAANVINHYIPRKNRPSWGIFLEELKDKIRGY